MTRQQTLPLLTAADIGNVNLKYRAADNTLVCEPALVRVAPTTPGFALDTQHPPRPLRYLEGPAQIASLDYLVGRDADRHGEATVSRMGSARMRLASDPYLLLHLAAILASLPRGQTTDHVIFAGGLPVDDASDPQVIATLRQRLHGTHTLIWDQCVYTITIAGSMFVPQPIGAIATLLLDPDGRVRSDGTLTRKRLVLDIGGGTTDFTGRDGLQLIPGTEGGVRIGIKDAAQRACQFIRRTYPALTHLDATQVLAQMHRTQPTVSLHGRPIAIQTEIDAALRQTSDELLAHVLPLWERQLAQGEVLVCGGGGERMAASLHQALDGLTRVTLLSNPIFRILDGIERLARRQLLHTETSHTATTTHETDTTTSSSAPRTGREPHESDTPTTPERG